ncbi:signal transduction histidine kinase [Diaminobutyricimonas aerilata]|uniref:histidine kinase n=1 Tax=Diaminobutyricimonas aerilata TaxID=1162967 RepID=A0A2M9CJH6_9MICO|nr:ATP-binding protein [Diaminobutyricimonas aerilata]PJJ72057.1 signal transduction histidine kinase [Diaminobutyricimonas aerilata]
MDDWLQANAESLVVAFAAVAAVLALALLIVLVALARTRRSVDTERAQRAEAERTAVDARLEVADRDARLRVLRELHEVAVRSVGDIAVRADGARHSVPDPAAAARAIDGVAVSARAALGDLRRVLAFAGDLDAPSEPWSGIRPARELFDTLRSAGLAIEVEETGARFPLTDGAEVAIYRILQEALVNALHHGGPGTTVRVGFGWTATGLQVKVDDDGLRVAGDGGGYTMQDDLRALTEVVEGRGIAEMRARTELFGGVLTAHRVPGVGFSLSAVFPTLRHHNAVHGVDLGVRPGRLADDDPH